MALRNFPLATNPVYKKDEIVHTVWPAGYFFPKRRTAADCDIMGRFLKAAGLKNKPKFTKQ